VKPRRVGGFDRRARSRTGRLVRQQRRLERLRFPERVESSTAKRTLSSTGNVRSTRIKRQRSIGWCCRMFEAVGGQSVTSSRLARSGRRLCERGRGSDAGEV
jgi:hypothetical protein